MATKANDALASFQSGKSTAEQYNIWAANPNSTIGTVAVAPAIKTQDSNSLITNINTGGTNGNIGILDTKSTIQTIQDELAKRQASGVPDNQTRQQFEEAQTTSQLAAGGSETPAVTPPTAESTIYNYNASASSDLEAKRKSLDDAYAKQQADLKTQQDASNAKISTAEANQKSTIDTIGDITSPWRADLETSERTRLKIEENYFENQKAVEEMDSLLTQVQQELQATKDVTGLASIRNPRIAKSTEDATARVGVLNAVIAARNGQISVAENLINRTTTAINADKQDQLSYYNTLLSFYEKQGNTAQDELKTNASNQKEVAQNQIALLENDLAESQKNVDYIKGLLFDPNTASICQQAGISLNDNIATVNQKLAQYTYTKEVQDTSNKMQTEGYTYMLPNEAKKLGASDYIVMTDSQGKYTYWKKPAEDVSTTTANVNGHTVIVNSKTGEVIKDLGVANSEISQSGMTGTTKLSAAQLDDLTTMDTLKSLGNDIVSLGEQIGWGGTGGLGAGSVSQWLAKNFGTGSEQEQNLRNMIGNVTATLAKLRGGTSFTANEQALLETYAPTINDSPLVIKSKVQSLQSFIEQKKQTLMSLSGQNSGNSDPLGIGSGTNNNNDPLGIGF